MDSTGVARSLNLDTGRLSHAYIADGGLADALAAIAVCSGPGNVKPCMACPDCGKASRRVHPDIIYIEKPRDKRDIIVEQIRSLKNDVIVIPVESKKKVYIVVNADLMNANAQNAFLRILEEPPGYAVFILSTENPAGLLSTVRSRCVELKSRPGGGVGPAAHDPAVFEMANDLFFALEQGNMELVRFMFALENTDKDAFGGFLDAAREIAVDKLKEVSPGTPAARREQYSRAESVLARANVMLSLNVGVGHLSGFICAALISE